MCAQFAGIEFHAGLFTGCTGLSVRSNGLECRRSPLLFTFTACRFILAPMGEGSTQNCRHQNRAPLLLHIRREQIELLRLFWTTVFLLSRSPEIKATPSQNFPQKHRLRLSALRRCPTDNTTFACRYPS